MALLRLILHCDYLNILTILLIAEVTSTVQAKNGTACERKHPRVRLCCRYGQVYLNGSCIDYSAFDLTMKLNYINNQEYNVQLDRVFCLKFGKPCEKVKEHGGNWRLFFNGSVKFEGEFINHRNYCLLVKPYEDVEEGNTRLNLILAKCDLTEILENDFKRKLIAYLMIVSVPFLIATFCIYAALPELRSVPTKCLLCYLFGLTVFYTMMAWMKLGHSDHVPEHVCKCFAVITYFFIISTFFWLNVISFDLWWNFNDLKRNGQSAEKSNRLVAYSAYAYGTSLGITSFAVGMDYLLDDEAGDFQPRFGEKECYMEEKKLTEFLYLYLPTSVISFLNILCFILIAYRISRVRKDLKAVTKGEHSQWNHKELARVHDKFTIYLRLLVMMGIPWLLEPVSRFTSCIFYFCTVCNSMQGVFIFTLFVCKRKIFLLIRKRVNRWFKAIK